MKKAIMIFISLLIISGTSLLEAQVFKRLRRGAPGAEGNGHIYTSKFHASATDTLGNLYLLIADTSYKINGGNTLIRTYHIETWNGTLWVKTSPVNLYNIKQKPNDYVDEPYIYHMVVHDGMVVIAGIFDSSANNQGRCIIGWDGVKWSKTGNGIHLSSKWVSNIYARRPKIDKMFEYKNQLVITGNFDSIGGDYVQGAAQMNSLGRWEPLGNIKNNKLFHKYSLDSAHFSQIVPPQIDIVLDSMYFYQMYYYIPDKNGYNGVYAAVYNYQQSKQWMFADSMGQALYVSDGKTHKPVSIPKNFVVRRVFGYKGQLHLMGHFDSSIYIKHIARRDSWGKWHIIDLPAGDSIAFNGSNNYPYLVQTLFYDHYTHKGNFIFAARTYLDIPSYKKSNIKFFEYDGSNITSHCRFMDDTWTDYSSYIISKSGNKKYLSGSFIHLNNCASGKKDSFYNYAAEILMTKTMVVKGKAFIDWNLDGVWQSYEPLLKNKMVYWKDSGYAVNTDAKGNYVLYLPAGSNREIKVKLNQYYVPAWSGSKIYSSKNDTVITSDFPFDVKLDRDLTAELIAYTGVKARRGAVSKYTIKITNISGKPVKGVEVKLSLSKKIINFKSSNLVSKYDSVNKIVTWNFPGTLQGDSFLYLNYNCKYSADSFEYGDTAYSEVRIVNNYSDADTNNNMDSLWQTISSAYDPNMKESNPRGAVTAKPDKIKYTIYFQNEGNDTALRVVVVDTLSVKMPVYEVEIGASSHPFHFTVENNIMVWEFDNIMLPNKEENETGSQGFLTFYAKTNKPMKVGDSLRNRAAIYFDYEKPVLTNYASIVMEQPHNGGLKKGSETLENFIIYPNPVENRLAIKSNSLKDETLKLYTIHGQFLQEINVKAGEEKWVDMSNISSGAYLLVGQSGGASKLIVNR